MLDTLITSKTRIKLLLKFFLNPENRSYLRSLATEFKESTNAIRLELNRFEKAGMLEALTEGNRKIFKANERHPLYQEVRSILLKYVGIDQIIDQLVCKLGNVKQVYLAGEFAKGMNSAVIDIILVGEVDRPFLTRLVLKVEKTIQKKVRYLIYTEAEFKNIVLDKQSNLLIWNR